MANHVRRQLREAAATLVTGLTTTGARVYQSRIYPVEDANLPCLLIYTTSEDAEPASIHDMIERRVELRVEAHAYASADVDDTLDLIAQEVEVALAPGVTINAKGIPLDYRGMSIEFDGDSERPRGRLTLQYQAKLFTAASAPDVVL